MCYSRYATLRAEQQRGDRNEEITQGSEQELCGTWRNGRKKGLKGQYIYIYTCLWLDGRAGPENVYSWMEDGGTHLRMMLEIFN